MNTVVTRLRGYACRVFAGCADQRLRLQVDLALSRMRGARCVLIPKMPTRVNAAIDRSRVHAGRHAPEQQHACQARMHPAKGGSDPPVVKFGTHRHGVSSMVDWTHPEGWPSRGAISDNRGYLSGDADSRLGLTP